MRIRQARALIPCLTGLTIVAVCGGGKDSIEPDAGVIEDTGFDAGPPEDAKADPSAQTLAQEKSLDTIARWMANYLRAYVLGDETARNYVEIAGDTADPDVTVVNRQ
ncbi:MAG: hypothetical protein HY897_03310 [Deltaproteobacteria bacterium]|nr:hypothetical protein [Deltaproteobacteria bacterium]